MKVTLPGAPKNESNQRGHWRGRAKRISAWRTKAALLVKSALVSEPLQPALLVMLTRSGPNELDYDGLVNSLKATRDGVADALRVNDATNLVRWEYAQVKGEPHVEVRIERIGQAAIDLGVAEVLRRMKGSR